MENVENEILIWVAFRTDGENPPPPRVWLEALRPNATVAYVPYESGVRHVMYRVAVPSEAECFDAPDGPGALVWSGRTLTPEQVLEMAERGDRGFRVVSRHPPA